MQLVEENRANMEEQTTTGTVHRTNMAIVYCLHPSQPLIPRVIFFITHF